MQSELSEKLKHIQLVVMDVDGTLTDGSMYYGEQGELMKRFSTRDGMGITLLHKAGIQTALITSENTAIVDRRAAKLGILHVIQGSRAKKSALFELIGNLGMILENVAFVGDDVNDATAMEVAGFSACPADASEYIKTIAHFVSSRKGGKGAVREICELILEAQDKARTLTEHW